MGSRKSTGFFSDDKFNRHVEAAEDYLRAGKYYKAADSFALASMYKPDNAQALAGRSHALFAAGEYMSSALFLSRALAIRPDYAKSRIDLVTLLGGQSRLAGRIADVEQWFARSGSPRLQLLLGYVYFQTGRLNEASRAIKAAHKKMPQSPAIGAIKAAIDAAATR
jgi:tetratricopeptide (TPR) repeat protein